MLYIAENLKKLRKENNQTQEEAAEALGISPQSVSKWERGETLPDITLLPALANLYKVSLDELVGMDKINDRKTKNGIFAKGHEHIRNGNIKKAVDIYTEALKLYPSDEAILSDLAMSLALDGEPEKLDQAVEICERLIADGRNGKIQHTTRAALCFIYKKAGEEEKANETARMLPHIRESRETILNFFQRLPSEEDIDTYLKFIAIGETDEQDVVEIDFGVDLIDICSDYGLLEKIETLRNETGATMSREGFTIMPPIRIRDKINLPPKMLRVRYFTDYLIGGEYTDKKKAVNDVIKALRRLAQKNIKKAGI